MYNSKFSRIVLAHDSFTQLGGAEKVVDALHEMYPDSPVYAVVNDPSLAKKYKDWDIRTTWLQHIYNFYPHFQKLLPLIPAAIESLAIEKCDILLSSSSGFARAFRKPKNAIHIDYCHTPTRFLWTDFEYIKQETPVLLRPCAAIFLKWMKKWDYKAAQHVDYFIANSKEVQGRIQKYYNRDSTVIYPCVDINFWKPTIAKQNYFLIAGRLQAHKKNDLIIEIFNELGLPLHVVGTGRQERYLKSISKPNITFYGRVTDEALREQLSGALGLIYPQLEDAGLTPLEAAACGTASVGYAKGGSLETIIPHTTGQLFTSYNKDEIKKIITDWKFEKFNLQLLQQHAAAFSKEKFKNKISEFIKEKIS